jgi:hypothetical protein
MARAPMNLFEPQHALGREHWGIPESRWQRALSWRGWIQFGLPLLVWLGPAVVAVAWMTTEPRSWGHFALAALFLILAGALSGRAIYLASQPDILICEAGLLLGRSAKCRRGLRWEESITCYWNPRCAQRLVVKTPREILEFRIPTSSSRERLSAELRRRGKWTEPPG